MKQVSNDPGSVSADGGLAVATARGKLTGVTHDNQGTPKDKVVIRDVHYSKECY